jgi:transposase
MERNAKNPFFSTICDLHKSPCFYTAAATMPNNGFHSIVLRAQALTLLTTGHTYEQTEKITGIPKPTLRHLKRRAYQRGYNPAEDARLREEFVIDGDRSGRPKEITEEKKQEVIENVRKDRNSREKSTEVLAFEASISPSSAWKILRACCFRSVKPTVKPGLSDKNRKGRLEFCLRYEDWMIEDWKNVIWTDETWVVIGQRRGKIRIWRQPGEEFNISCIRQKHKKSGAGDFMLWGCFSYDKKGPCYIWKEETAAEKKAAKKEISQLNREREPILKAEWSLQIQCEGLVFVQSLVKNRYGDSPRKPASLFDRRRKEE